MKMTIAKGCLYCGLRLPEQADFCPECGRPVEVVIRFESDVQKMKTTIARGCPHCGLQFPDSVDFCPECGRPVERGRIHDTTQESDSDCPDAEIKGKDELVRQHGDSSNSSDPLADKIHRMCDERAYVNLILTLMMLA